VKDDNPFHFIPLWSPTGEWVAYLGRALQLPDRGGYRGVMQPIDKAADGHSERSDYKNCCKYKNTKRLASSAATR